jgi:amidase
MPPMMIDPTFTGRTAAARVHTASAARSSPGGLHWAFWVRLRWFKLPAVGAAPRLRGSPETRPVCYLALVDIARRIQSRDVSPVDLTQRMLDRIASVDRSLKSYATLMRDDARATARAAEQEIRSGRYRGSLHGVPVAVKDPCYTKGVRTMGGTKVRQDFVPDVSATVVSRLRAAGAVVLGKPNPSEGAAAGYNPARDVPINPWNPDRWPGMSSSGSGVATAAGLCYATIGTDTRGSIRCPSSAKRRRGTQAM